MIFHWTTAFTRLLSEYIIILTTECLYRIQRVKFHCHCHCFCLFIYLFIFTLILPFESKIPYDVNTLPLKRLYMQDLTTCRNAHLLVPANPRCLPALGGRAFQSAAPKLWNSLPAEIRNIQSLTSFKRALKDSF